jgi:tungstate transport system substrate-binding protein
MSWGVGRHFVLAAVVLLVIANALSAFSQEAVSGPQIVRCAAVGGLNEIDFWPQLADRFQRATGNRLEFVAMGPKHAIVEAFKSGEADVILMHSGDAMINLVADGLGENPQPWAKNDFLIVGPVSDPAKIKGEKDAVAALGKIVETKSKFLLHASSGANELVSDLLAAGELELAPEATISLQGDRQRLMLKKAAEEQAYTLVGRIPFLSGKLDTGGLEVMVQGDEKLRRAFLVVTAVKRGADANEAARLTAARRFAAFLREADTQAFIAGFGKGRYDERALLFAVKVP